MIVITGASGFIGSAIVWALNQEGRENLLLVDELGKGDKWKNLAPLKYGDYLEKNDFLGIITHPKTKLQDVETVIHMGAESSTTETNASLLVKNNFEYTKHLAIWCAANSVRFIYASSAATYGNGSNGYCDDEKRLNSLRPLNMYGYSKHMFDLWAAGRGLLNKFVGLKYFNVYGPNEYHKGDMRSMVVKAYEQIHATGKVRLFQSHKKEYRDGEQLRDFIYVKDAAAMTLHFLNPDVPGGLYNIGTGKAQTWLQMMNALFSALELKPEIEFIPMPQALKNKYQYYTRADNAKLKAAGYNQPTMPLEQGVADYVEYLEHGYKTLGS